MKSIMDIERERAKFAYMNVKKYMDNVNSEEDNKKFKSYVRKLPMLILNNGLLNTMGFLKGKDNEDDREYSSIFTCIQEWQSKILKYIEEQSNVENTYDYIFQCNTTNYQILTKETLNFCVWYKRIAEGLI